jgi:hypothetical protein
MAEIPLPPYAPVLIESMRSIGYSFESAVADLVDNSISADATRIDIHFRPFGNPYIAIVDNGEGMDANTLMEAMRHGSRNPLEERAENDHGRFGLGLKTASLSQCRKLTVVSCRGRTLATGCWDLDLIAERKDWVLKVAAHPEVIRELPHVRELEEQGRGTIVLWQGFDRLAAGEVSVEAALGEKIDRARDHLSLVFHRYLSGDSGTSRLQLLINNNPVQPADPFLSKHPATQRMYDESFSVDGQVVHVQPFILPHVSKLTAEELALAGGEDGLRRKQGFYVYRNRRLIIWGTWFHLARQRELTKLARVQVDIPNGLDHLWALDVKKSGAHPPEEVRRNLGRIVDRIADRSRRTYTYRGRRTNVDGHIRAWYRIEGRGGIHYDINRDHPLVIALSDKLDHEQQKLLELLLQTLEVTFPADTLYADMADDRPREASVENPETTLRELAARLLSAVSAESRQTFLAGISKIEPFSLYPEITSSLIGELTHAE